MAIDKITPLRLDKTSDFKIIPETSMVDALNMLISEDAAFGGSVDSSSESGDLGVLKNVKGNTNTLPAYASDAIAAGNAKIIGSVTDTKLKILYFFVWHEIASEHGVWAYDPMGKLPNVDDPAQINWTGNYTHRIRKIHKSNLYNFPQHGFVKADIIYTSQSRLNDSDIKAGGEKDFEKDAILYFTDNTNEPRKLNVYMALTYEDENYTEESDRIDFITACPKVPLTPITFEFNADSNKLISGFKSGPGFQFAYQFVYKDGMESSISPYSDIAFAPSIINQGANTNPNHGAYNRCQLTIPENGENIGSIKILARQFNNPEMVIIDEVPASEAKENWDYISRIYSFYNDRIPKGVSQNEVNKQYDNLPRKAQAQAVVDNRLMYGNYLEGFDNIEIDCEAEVNFIKRPPDFIDLELKLIPAISEQTQALGMEYPSGNPAGTINKSAGYVLSGSGIPPHIEDGTRFNITVKIAPENNFHIYQATNSYHQSRHRGVFKQYEEYQINYAEPETFDGGNYGYGHQNFDESGAQWIADNVGDLSAPSDTMTFNSHNFVWGVPYSGNNYGVGGAGDQNAQGGPGSAQGGAQIVYQSPKWKTVFGTYPGSQKEVCYGTSAGNPLILKGGNIVFSCSFTTGSSSGAGQDMIVSKVSSLLSGGFPTWGGDGHTIVHDVQTTFEHNIDLSNQGLELWDRVTEGTLYSKLISGVVEKKTPLSYEPFSPPIGHFIVRKANVTFSLERDEAYGSGTGYKMLRLSIDKISDVETVTVIRKKFPDSPWFVVTKEFFESGNIDELYENTTINYGGGTITTGMANFGEIDAEGDTDYRSQYYPVPIRVIPEETNNEQDWDYLYAYSGTGLNLEPITAIPGSAAAMLGNLESFDVMDSVCVAGTNAEYSTNTPLIGNSAFLESSIPPEELNQTLENNLFQLNLGYFFGYLDFQQDGVIDNFFRFNREAYQADNPNNTELFPFSLLDGEGGPGAKLTHNYIEGPGAGSPSLSSAPRSIEYSVMDTSVIPTESLFVSIEGLLTIQPRVWVWGAEFTGSITCRHVPSVHNYYHHFLYGLGSVFPNANLIANGFKASGFLNYKYATRSILPLMQGHKRGSNPYWLNGGLSKIQTWINIGVDDYYTKDVPYTSNFNEPIEYAGSLLEDGFPNTTASGPGGLKLSIDIAQKHPHIEITSVLQSVGNDNESDRTFKSSANHDFGIVYYDERGRHGFVNHLKTVYVPGYSQQERGVANFGRSEITLTIQPEAPEWAHSYKIVYTKNTTVENFIQYTVGGAFIKKESTSNLITDTNIYVSLNYLQESPISYVSDFGARDPEGGLNMFKYLPGRNQKLRVISSYNNVNQRHYHHDYEFAISDFVILGDTDNPLTTSTGDKPFKMGAFLVLKNNDSADGFSHTDIKAALNADETSRWDQNCVIEIYTPARDQERFYYEIGDTYSITQPGTPAATHSQTNITLRKGDVWWRKVAVNFRPYESEGVYMPGYYMTTNFPDLIQYTEDLEEPNPSTSNFESYYLETETASDLFKADATLIGRPNIISEDAVESIREASITYSDQSNPNSSVVNYSSFNLTLFNFKDLQEEFGDINYMCNMEGDVFVIQSDRCTLVPASKTLFSDVSGVDTVAASKSPLGQERIYAGRAGCDNNPESAVQVGSYVYFAHKNLGKIFRFNPSNGVQVISDQGMASYFRTLFQEAMASSQDINYNDIRVVGGFDPVQEEYLLTVLYNTTYEDALPGPVEDISYEEDIVDIGVIDPFTDIDQVSDEVSQQFNEVFLGRIPDGAEIDMSGPISTWFHLLEGPMFLDTLNFGNVERTPSGTEVTRDFYISNMGDENVFVKIRPSYPLKFYANDKYPSQFGQGHYRNPSFKHIKNELGITQVGQFGLENVKTLIPAGTYHTFTMTINVNEQEHSYVNGYSEPNFSISSTEATQYLIDTFGTTKRALTSSERSLGGENIPNELLAERNYYDSMQASSIEFEVYNLADQLILGVDDIGSFPYRRKEWQYQIVDELEGDVLPGTPDVVTETAEVDLSGYADYSADLNNDGFVGSQDLLELLGNYGSIGDSLVGDINNDGAVTVDDLLILLNQFGDDAPSVYDVLDVPPLDLDAFAQALVTASAESLYEGVTEINLNDVDYYFDVVVFAGEGLVSTVLFNQFPEVWNFVSGGQDFMSVLQQVYLTDDNGNLIPYGGVVESGAPAFDLCSWPVLQNQYGVIDISVVTDSFGNLGDVAFFDSLPPFVGQYVSLNFNTFVNTYLTDDNGQPITLQCEVQPPSLSLVSFGISLSNTLTNTYGIDTSSATTYVDLYSINIAVSQQILSQTYPDVWSFVNGMSGYWGDNFEQLYLTDANGVAIPFDGGGMPGGPGGSGGGGGYG
tara:strand:+ start:571 stop:7656 length:7086 start_codon:yes stop_codon:yes gene_type:complete